MVLSLQSHGQGANMKTVKRKAVRKLCSCAQPLKSFTVLGPVTPFLCSLDRI